MQSAIFVSTSLFVMLVCPLSIAGEEELRNEALIGHKMSIDLIETFSSDYVSKEDFPSNNVLAKGSYLRRKGEARIMDGAIGEVRYDCLVSNGRGRTLNRVWGDKGNSIVYSARQQSSDLFFSWGDIWREMLVDHLSLTGKRRSVAEMMQALQPTATTTIDYIDKVKCIKTEADETTPDGNYTYTLSVWHDTSHNYLVRRFESNNKKHNESTIIEVIDFKEFKPGVFFPIGVVSKTRHRGQLVKTRTTLLENVKINEAVNESEMLLPSFPVGTRLNDEIDNRIGPMDKDWRIDGPSTPLMHMMLPTKSKNKTAAEVVVKKHKTINNVILLIASSCLVLLCVYFIRRSLVRSRAENSQQ